MNSFVANMQGMQDGSFILPQEISAAKLSEDKVFHAFGKLSSDFCDKTSLYVIRNIHGIPPDYGEDRLIKKFIDFLTEDEWQFPEIVVYVKGEQQADSFRRLLAGIDAVVENIEHVKTFSWPETKCVYHKRFQDLFCAREKCLQLKCALLEPSAPSSFCVLHNKCEQPNDLCHFLWGLGTYKTLTTLWSPTCVACQNPLFSPNAVQYFCTVRGCGKFNTCVLRVKDVNTFTRRITYVSGVRLNKQDLKRKFYLNW